VLSSEDSIGGRVPFILILFTLLLRAPPAFADGTFDWEKILRYTVSRPDHLTVFYEPLDRKFPNNLICKGATIQLSVDPADERLALSVDYQRFIQELNQIWLVNHYEMPAICGRRQLTQIEVLRGYDEHPDGNLQNLYKETPATVLEAFLQVLLEPLLPPQINVKAKVLFDCAANDKEFGCREISAEVLLPKKYSLIFNTDQYLHSLQVAFYFASIQAGSALVNDRKINGYPVIRLRVKGI